MGVIFNIGIFFSFFIVLLLLFKQNKSLADKILALWMLFIGLHLLSYHIYMLGYWERFPHLIGVTVPFPLLHGPMLYLYTVAFLRKDRHLIKADYLHFIPALLAYFYMFDFYFFYTPERKIMVDKGEVNDFALFIDILLVLYMVSGLYYAILAYRVVNQYKRLIDRNLSYDENLNINWIKYCIWGIGTIFISAALIIISRELLGFKFSFNADYVFYSLIIFFVCFIGFFWYSSKRYFCI